MTADRVTSDIIVIGGGIAGASAAANLAAHHRVTLIEAEDVAGYHTTGRSAAIWVQNFGPDDVRLLSRLSRAFFANPPEGFTDVPLLHHRPVLFLAARGETDALDRLLAHAEGLRPISVAAARELVPAIIADNAAAAAIEDDAFDMDVSALHQGYLRQLRALGGTIALRSRATRIDPRGGIWRVHTQTAEFVAPIIVNAAGAWADEVAGLAGLAPLGLRPLRRTALIIDPAPFTVADWPMVIDAAHQWYARPEARTRLLISPEDETPDHPHDVQPEELDIALAIDRMQSALAIPVRRVERSWAGLRTFSPDGSLIFGRDPRAAGFFWCAGQGGYGIQTAPAAGRLLADLLTWSDPAGAAAAVPMTTPARFIPPAA